jgi:hypothetical protein
MNPTSTAITERELLAGAKAGYERFYSYMDATPSCPWSELTEKRRNQWVQIAKAAYREITRVQSRRAARRLLSSMGARRIAPCGKLN